MKEIFLETEVKLNIHIEPIDGLSMDDYDFEVEAYCTSRRSKLYKKHELTRVDADNYIVKVDSSEVGVGELKLTIKAEIPDADFDDGFRTEVMSINTRFNIVRPL